MSGFAAFDTRVDMPRIFTGSAATAISTRLRKRGLRELVRPESFLVDKDSRLLAGELERAHAWGAALAPRGALGIVGSEQPVTTMTATKGSAASLTFLGAADTVTGSRYLVSAPSSRILVDCGCSRIQGPP